MFELEILEALKKIKTTNDEYELKKLKKSLSNLIKENPQKYEQFTHMQALDDQSMQIINECEQIENEIDQNTPSNETNDFEIIKKYYLKWLEIYQNNNFEPTTQNEQIVINIINFYTQNRIEVLLQILKMNDDENFESFKNMLKNYLRKYFAEKINAYYKSDRYNTLGFFEKKRKNRELMEIVNMIGKYKFEYKKVYEVLK